MNPLQVQKELGIINAIIVDDELHGRENLKKIIETYCAEVKILGVASSVVEAQKLMSVNSPDVVFLDINMPVLDGFDFLDEYENREFMVVFVSAYEEYGIKALKAGAVDYLLKPINIKELKVTVKKILALKSKSASVEKVSSSAELVLPSSHGFDVFEIDNIIRLEADGCYTNVVIKESKNVIVSRTLKDFEETLPKEKFYRIHKSHLINIKHVKDFRNTSGNFVTMSDGSTVEISRRKVSEFVQKIKSALSTV